MPGRGTRSTLRGPSAACRRRPSPRPRWASSVEPERDEDRERLGEALASLVREDPSLRVRLGGAGGQWTLEGMGEPHLEIAVQALVPDHGVAVRVTAPRVALAEVPQAEGSATGRIRREDGEGFRFGAATIHVAPRPGQGQVSWHWDEGCGIPEGLRGEVEAALRAASGAGPRPAPPSWTPTSRSRGGERAGRGLRGCVLSGGRAGLHDACLAAEVRVEEPLAAYEVVAPEEFASAVAGDSAGRGAIVEEVRSGGALRVMAGRVPLARMVGYATGLRSVSQGRASHSLRPVGRAPLSPADLAALGLQGAP